MIIVGIDNSVNSPGVVYYELDSKLNPITKNFIGFTQVKKNTTNNIFYYKKKDFENTISQYLWNRDIIFDRIINSVGKPDYIAFEDYAYAALGKVFNIAESTAALKIKGYEYGMKIRLYDPCSIKMASTGYGNADKTRMMETYNSLPQEDKLVGDINEDIIDAYFIIELLRLELKLRNGLINLKDLNAKQIQVFNRVTKAHPTNILDEDFIFRK